ncbi:MAG TPA: response regulator [Candidatus Angelobacter sp.]|nr:response regulator [Candidatus Angelobacter sp.]
MKVLFVDDEGRRMEAVVEELKESGHEVNFQASMDPALAILADQNQRFDVVIFDVSMPSGKTFQAEDTDGGARTGLNFYAALRQLRPKLKAVVFTNVADRGVEEHFKKQDRSLCLFIRKPSVLPFQFVEELEGFVGVTEVT